MIYDGNDGEPLLVGRASACGKFNLVREDIEVSSILSQRSPVVLRMKAVNLLREWYLRTVWKVQSRMKVRASFSQAGEDLIVLNALRALGVAKPTYLDVGAYHPYELSNTAFLYREGCRGINIEPNPDLFAAFPIARPGDINLNCGIAAFPGELDYHFMSVPTLNTFSEEEAETFIQAGYLVVGRRKVPVRTLTDIVDTYSNGQFPDFLSLDVEGLEMPILQSIDFAKTSPKVICVETMSFASGTDGQKDREIIDFITAQGYWVYADTYLNTILVRNAK